MQISEPNQLIINGLVTDATCSTCTDGTINANGSGGVPPYSYVWGTTPVQTTRIAQALAPGSYTVTVTDFNGCTATKSFSVWVACNLTVEIGNDTAVCFNPGYTLTASVSNGTSPYSYMWNTGAASSTAWVDTPYLYVVTVTDALGCTVIDSINLLDLNSAAGISGDTTICVAGVAQLLATGGTVYSWTPATGLSDTNIANPIASPSSTIHYTVEINNGTCTTSRSVTVTVDTACVWPGDADNSGLADNNDVLAIGLAYGNTGLLRNNASIVWEGQQGTDWASTLANGTNHKHVDTNGDGIINADDTLAISVNYGLTHLKTEEDNRAVNPTLYLEMPDTVLAGETVFATIFLGNDTTIVPNVYGIKFAVSYNNSLVDTNSVYLYLDTCWMGSVGVDLIGFTKDMYASGRVEIAITRINQVGVTGGGPIGLLSFTMKDDVSGKDLLAIPMELEIFSERAIDSSSQDLPLTTAGTSIIVVQDTSVGINNTKDWERKIRIYPNPTNGLLHIQTSTGASIEGITLVNLLGQSVTSLQITNQSDHHTMDVSEFARGVYMLHMVTSQGIIIKRIMLQ